MAKKLSNHFLSRIKVESRRPFWNNLFLFFLLFNLRWAQLYVSLVHLSFSTSTTSLLPLFLNSSLAARLSFENSHRRSSRNSPGWQIPHNPEIFWSFRWWTYMWWTLIESLHSRTPTNSLIERLFLRAGHQLLQLQELALFSICTFSSNFALRYFDIWSLQH